MDYIANSKNRKFKKQILVFFDRVTFGLSGLPIPGKMILILVGILFLSLFFPWLELEYTSKEIDIYTAFSYFTGYIGYAILLHVLIVPFFLLSHTKKERIRSFVPFRLSDTQVVVFVSSMLLAALIHFIFMLRVFSQFSTPDIRSGFLLAISSVICMIASAFFLSRQIKEGSVGLRHIDHREVEIPDEYATILGKNRKKDAGEDSNMVLPI